MINLNKRVKIKKKINKNKKNKKVLFIVLTPVLLCLIGLASYFIYLNVNGESKYLKISLNGKKHVVINYLDNYEDKGASAFYKNKDISKDIKVKKNINFEKLGTYTYTYTIKYKRQEKSIKRTVKIVDKEAPIIALNGDGETTIYVGTEFIDKGAIATDNYDVDLTDKIETSGTVNKDAEGTYIITYKVVDSSNNEAKVERKVNVVSKPKPNQKIAVLNYHFFYEDYDAEPCHEIICEKMDRFREQLQWLNDNGYKTLTMKEFVSWMYGEIDVPEKSVLITIDDGAYGTGKHNGNHLIPALEQYKIHATLFLITGWWDISNYRSPYLEVESHTNNLHEIGSCGSSNVNCVGYDNLVTDLKKSIEITGSKQAFCFPFYSSSSESVRAVRDVGFKVAFIGGNRKASRNDNKYQIPRYPIHDSTTLSQFINMVR